MRTPDVTKGYENILGPVTTSLISNNLGLSLSLTQLATVAVETT